MCFFYLRWSLLSVGYIVYSLILVFKKALKRYRKAHILYTFSPSKGFEKSSFPWQSGLNQFFSTLNFVLHCNAVLITTVNMPNPAVLIPASLLLETLVGPNARYRIWFYK